MEVERKLKKINEHQFELTTIDKEHDLKTIKGYEKSELKNIYKELKLRTQQSRMQKAKLEKDVEKLDVDDTPDLREFTEKLVAAQKLAEKDKIEDQLKMVKTDLDLLANQTEELVKAIPELSRQKK